MRSIADIGLLTEPLFFASKTYWEEASSLRCSDPVLHRFTMVVHAGG